MPMPLLDFNVIANAVEGTVSSIEKIIDNTVTTDAEKLDRKNQLTKLVLDSANQAAAIQASIIINEANGSKLQRNWRPIVMLAFAFVVVYTYFLQPVGMAFSEKLIPVEIPDRFWSLLEIGIGGYVIGRTVEKVTTDVTKNIDITTLRKKDRKKFLEENEK